MNLFKEIKTELLQILKQEFGENIEVGAVVVEPPKDVAHGDMSTNAAMVLAGILSKKPRELAELIIQRLLKLPLIVSAEIAGPGFINMRLQPEAWAKVLLEIIKLGSAYGTSTIGAKERVNVEYVSANPTGPMHIGHARGAVYGDALASLLTRAGFDVTREYYINDAGAQIETLARSVYLRYIEALGEDVSIPEGLYPGEYLKPVGQMLAKKFGADLLEEPETTWLPIVREIAVKEMLVLIKKDLADLGVKHDVFVSERALQEANKVEHAINELKEKQLVYEGILEAPKGKTPEDWEPREQLLFKATQFGDDVDRPLQKSDGTFTYFAADIAYHSDKLMRGFNHMVIVLGADHGGYIKRLKAIVKALSEGKASIDVKISQLVNFLHRGVPLKMSKRKGSFTTVRDVVDEVGADVVRFIMLTRKNDVVLDFDLELVKEQSKDNPVFYVQYAHARCCSVLRHAAAEISDMENKIKQVLPKDLLKLSDPSELALIKLLGAWPRMVEFSAIAHEPHRIAFFVQEVAAHLHALWNKGNENAMLRFIVPTDAEVTILRLVLVQAVVHVIAAGLEILGVVPVTQME